MKGTCQKQQLLSSPSSFTQRDRVIMRDAVSSKTLWGSRAQLYFANSGRHRKTFNFLDADSNGEITKSEMLERLPLLPDPINQLAPGEISFIFDIMDTDESGGIEIDEFCFWFDKMTYEYNAFKTADANGDGKIDVHEWHDLAWGGGIDASSTKPPTFAEILARYDPARAEQSLLEKRTNPMKYVTRACTLKCHEVDSNKDGYISFPEYFSALDSLQTEL